MDLIYNNTNITKVKFNGQPVSKIIYNGIVVYSKTYQHTIRLSTNPIWSTGYCGCELTITTDSEDPITSWNTLLNILEQKRQEQGSPALLTTLTGLFYESTAYQINNRTVDIASNGVINYWYTTSYDSSYYISRSVNPVEALGNPPILTDTVTEIS